MRRSRFFMWALATTGLMWPEDAAFWPYYLRFFARNELHSWHCWTSLL